MINKDTLLLPARSEVIMQIQLLTKERSVFVPNQTLQSGILMARAIVDIKVPS